jgi:hypothetical protein
MAGTKRSAINFSLSAAIPEADFGNSCQVGLDHGFGDYLSAFRKFTTDADFPEQYDPPVLRRLQHVIEHCELLPRL